MITKVIIALANWNGQTKSISYRLQGRHGIGKAMEQAKVLIGC